MQRRTVLLAAAGIISATILLAAVRPEQRSSDYRKNAATLLRAAPDAERIWAHRVNSLGALGEAKQIFAGVELDLVFDARTRRFEVRHPPKPANGLTLDRYLAAAVDRPALRLWLDWKNPASENLGSALAELARLDAKYGLRRRALVETPSDATFSGLEALSRAGFLHGYYLPTEAGLAALQQGPRAMSRLGASIRATVERGNYAAITYDARLQPFVDRELSAFLREGRIRRFSWDQSIDSSNPATDPRTLSAMTQSRSLEALLITFPSRYRI